VGVQRVQSTSPVTRTFPTLTPPLQIGPGQVAEIPDTLTLPETVVVPLSTPVTAGTVTSPSSVPSPADGDISVWSASQQRWVTGSPTSFGVGPGSGTSVAVKDEGSTVVATASALNFVGAGVSATDGGSGVATVTIPGGGTSYRQGTDERWVPRQSITSNFVGDPTKAVTGVAATGIFTAASHGYAVGDLVVFVLTTGGSGLTAGLPYYVVATNFASGTFSVALAPGGSVVTFASDLTSGTVARKRDGYLFNLTNMIYTTSGGRPALRAADGGSGTIASLFTKETGYADWELRVRYRPANDATTSSTDYGPSVYGGWEDVNNNWHATAYHASGSPVYTIGATVAGTSADVSCPADASARSTTQDRIVKLRKTGDLIQFKDWPTNVGEPDWQISSRIRPPIGTPSVNTTTDNPERGAAGVYGPFCGAYLLEVSLTKRERVNPENLLHNASLNLLDLTASTDARKVLTGVASTGVFTTSTAHSYAVGDVVVFGGMTTRTGSNGLVPGRSYYVAAVPSGTTFTVATSRGGAAITFTNDVTEVGAWCIRNPIPAFWTRSSTALLAGNSMEVLHVVGPDGTIVPALSMVCATPNDPNLSWYQYLWNPLSNSGAGVTNQRLNPHPKSIPARRLEFSGWVKGAVTAIQASGLGIAFDIYMYDAFSIATLMDRQTYHPGLSPTALVDTADPQSFDGAQTVSTFDWTYIKSIIEVSNYESIHQMRAQVLFHEATDTGNVLLHQARLRPIF
jgi:hypothetical protein